MTDTQHLNTLKIDTLHALGQPPELYDPGEPLFWNDPYISKILLDTHLNPDTEAASRPPATIDAMVNWLLGDLALEPGAAWLDIGCGPGLYTARLAQHGLRVTGIDFSERSIAYARDYATEHRLDITYRLQNYLTLEDAAQYDVVSLIYGDFCPLFPAERATLLDRVHRALKPGGRFVFDLSTPLNHQRRGLTANWYTTLANGLWMAGPHLTLERRFAYPDDIFLDQYIVIEPDGTTRVYRFWFQDYTPERIAAELAEHGFRVRALWGDLAGTPYAADDSEWLAVVAEHA